MIKNDGRDLQKGGSPVTAPQFFCYMLECADGSYYTGWSTNPERRLIQHNQGAGSRYTRSRRPVKLVYVEEVVGKGEALKRERAIKALPRQRKQKLIGKKG